MTPTDIFVVRHGETEYNRLNRIQGRTINASLNEKGINQSEALNKYFRDRDIGLIVSSSLKRSIETAEIIAGDGDVQMLSFPELDEIHFGTAEGKNIHEIRDQLLELHHQWKSGNLDFALDGGESPKQVWERAGRKVREIISEHPGIPILFVLHGRLIRILISCWLDMGLHRMHKVRHSNGALNHLVWDGKQFQAVSLHNTDHLETAMSD